MAGTPSDTHEGQWLTVSEAARALGVSVQSVRRRIKRGTLEARRDNRRGTLVLLDANVGAAPGAIPVAAENAVLRERVAGLEATVAAQERHIADLRAEVERLRWPGLWPALRRFWRGG